MKQHVHSFLRRALRDQRAQVLPLMAFTLIGFIGFAGCVIDVGKVYYAYNELQTSTQAAALAGAQAISNANITVPGYTAATTSPDVVAKYYSSGSGDLNANSIFVTDTPTVTISCISALAAAPYGISCIPFNGAGAGSLPTTANAIQVQQQATVSTWFVGLFGAKSITLYSYASAARAGAASTPYNVAIIVDSTASMASTDSNCSFGSMSRFQCALDGIQVLLENMAPCYSSSTSCGSATDGAVSPSVDRVALFTFPNITTASMPYEYCAGGSGSSCASSGGGGGGGGRGGRGGGGGGGSSLVTDPYTYPSPNATSYTSLTIGSGSSATAVSYLVTYAASGLGSDSNGFVSDYKTSDTTSTLNSASSLVKAIGATSTSTAGMGDPGGAGTYYAGVIYAAEAALYAEKLANPGSENVLIILSDGDAGATSSSDFESSNNGFTFSSTSGNYPSMEKECQQAVIAAGGTIGSNWTPDTAAFTTARASILRIYAIAYGAEASATCTGDTYTPCETMKGIASSSGYFYADSNQSGSGIDANCVGTANSTSNLAQIFSDIASDFTNARLIPNSVFGST